MTNQQKYKLIDHISVFIIDLHTLTSNEVPEEIQEAEKILVEYLTKISEEKPNEKS